MKSVLEGLEPQLLWKYFGEVSRIPRGSGNEEAVAKYVAGRAKELGLDYTHDEANNVIVRKPASAELASAPIVCLQCHLDMVCEKNKGTDHDFERDPIELVKDGEWIGAAGTTLGADDGIGVAACLALMEAEDLRHGPLELIFTADEETGMTGAAALDPSEIKARVMLNLDMEEEGVFTIGCAGGADTVITLSMNDEEADGELKGFTVQVKGLKGGHSGAEIHLRRGNALRLLSRCLVALGEKVAWRLAACEGGSKRNAIPREAEATILIPAGGVETALKVREDLAAAFAEEFGRTEPELELVFLETGATPGRAATVESSRKLATLLLGLPHGVEAMSSAIDGLVETSTNLAKVGYAPGGAAVVETSQRSSVESCIDEIVGRVTAVACLAGATLIHEGRYPGWNPDPESKIVKVATAVHESVTGAAPKVEAIHAGLECGLFARKIPDMDMISFGPTVRGAHSPDEKLHIPAVPRFWKLLLGLLEACAK